MKTPKVDIILPVLAFLAILITGLWTILKNGQWWTDLVPEGYMPSKILYYVVWILFVIVYPFAYAIALSPGSSKGYRAMVHILFLLIALFMLSLTVKEIYKYY